MDVLFFIFIFFFGLIIGSFLNVVIIRLHSDTSFGGRSICPHCNTQLTWYDNIPIVSFCILMGKCRYCSKKISIQYPLVELTTGILFVLAFQALLGYDSLFALAHVSSIETFRIILTLYFISILIVIFVYDLRWYLILDIVTLPAIVAAFIGQMILGESISHLVIAGSIGGGFFLLQFLVSKGRWIGGGDIRLGLLMGFMLSFPHILVALMVAYFIGGIFGIVLLSLKKKHFGDKLPFGTFLTVATVITLLSGDRILEWYLYSFLR